MYDYHYIIASIVLLYAAVIDIRYMSLARHKEVYVALLLLSIPTLIGGWPLVLLAYSLISVSMYVYFMSRYAGMGGADGKIYIILSVIYPISVVIIILFSSIMAVIYSVYRWGIHGLWGQRKVEVPFIPFIAGGSMILNTFLWLV